MDGKVYVVGGCDTWNCLNTVECYDPEKNSWSFIKPIITPRRGCGLAHIKGKYFNFIKLIHNIISYTFLFS